MTKRHSISDAIDRVLFRNNYSVHEKLALTIRKNAGIRSKDIICDCCEWHNHLNPTGLAILSPFIKSILALGFSAIQFNIGTAKYNDKRYMRLYISSLFSDVGHYDNTVNMKLPQAVVCIDGSIAYVDISHIKTECSRQTCIDGPPPLEKPSVLCMARVPQTITVKHAHSLLSQMVSNMMPGFNIWLDMISAHRVLMKAQV